MKKREHLWVCWSCLQVIESREGKQPTLIHYVDEDDVMESKCNWCENTGYDELYELI